MTPSNQVRFYSWNSTITSIRESAAISYALTGSVLKHSLITTFFVGCILSLLNEGDVLFEGRLTSRVLMKIVMNFVVPFLVSSISAVVNRCMHFPAVPPQV